MANFIGVFLLASIIGLCSGHPRIINGRRRGGSLGKLPVPPDTDLPKGQFFTQYLDHFNDADIRTWQQQYFVNYTYYKHGGPVFLLLGGEAAVSATWAVNGQWITRYAKKFNAVCFLLEHRFYGKSRPTADLSNDNLKYLSSEQSLADAAYFIAFKKKQLNLKTNKWITFGGSYSGSLSAWFRMKYPHLADGAVATSAPVEAILDFKDFLKVTVESLNTGGSDCVPNVQAASDMVDTLMATLVGRDTLRQQFRLCEDIEFTYGGVGNFYVTLTGNFVQVVQYNKDNLAFAGDPGANITIDTLCSIMRDSAHGNVLDRYAAVNTLILKTYSEPCLEISYTKMIKDLKSVAWNSSAAEGGRQWIYQTCTEFGFYQSSDLPNQPFTHEFPIRFEPGHVHIIAGGKSSRQVKTYLFGQLWTTAIDNGTKNSISPTESRTHSRYLMRSSK